MSTSFTKHLLNLVPEHGDDKSSVLIAAGDIASSTKMLETFLEEVAPRFMAVILIAGNHEYYGHVRQEHDATMNIIAQRFFKHHVAYVGLENAEICFDNLTVIAGTLWGDGGKGKRETELLNKYMRCFKVIKESFVIDEAPFEKVVKYTPQMMRQDNLAARNEFRIALEKAVETSSNPVVMASHYIPFRQICHPRFGGEIDGGFASDCYDVIRNVLPSGWIFGHTHDTFNETVEGIPMFCNPSGYFHENGSVHNDYTSRFVEISELAPATVKTV